MKTNRNEWRKTNRVSIWSFGSRPSRYDPDRALYSSLFIQDVHNMVMPIGGRSYGNLDFEVELRPNSSVISDILAEALQDGSDYHRDSLTEALCDFISTAAAQLAYDGRVVYEVVKGPPSSQDPTISNFSLSRLPVGIISLMGPWYFQYVPMQAIPKFRRLFVVIPKSKILDIRLPIQLGTRSNHKRSLKKLVYAGEAVPFFAIDDMTDKDRVLSFDTEVYKRKRMITMYQATQKWGWIPSQSIRNDPITEFYYLSRATLRFQKALALVRAHIISHLNLLMKQLGWDTSIAVNGLPTVMELETIERRFVSGEAGFDDIGELLKKI